MKKYICPLVFLAVLANSCKKEDVPIPEINTVSTERKALLFDFTGTWCPPCGANGLPVYNGAKEKWPYRVCPISIHLSAQTVVDSFECSTGQMLQYYDSVTGIPDLWVDNVWQPTDSADVNDAIREVLAQTPVCGIGAKFTISGNTITIKTKTVFFTSASDSFSLAVYITENDCYAVQASSNEV